MPARAAGRCICLLMLVGTIAQTAGADFPADAAKNWHRWRGPEAGGVAPHGDPPLTWDAAANIKWKTPIEGRGSASPIVWGNRIFLLTAVDAGKQAPGATASQTPENQKNLHQFKVLCLDRATGKPLWERTAREATPHEQLHKTNTYASGSPTTDGEFLYASFGSFGVYCYDLDGNLQWERDLGDMTTRNQFGEGASPTIHGDTLVINWDQESDSKIFALDAKTGATKWEKPRDEVTSWNTPLVVTAGGRTQAVVNGTTRSRGYDLVTGDVLWECGGQTTNAIASPVAQGNIVYCMSGFRGNAVYAIPLDAVGDITDTDKIVWHSDKSGPYVPSPILYDGRLYFCKSSNNIISCLDALTGEPLVDQQRVAGLGDMYASPVGAAGRVYFTGRDGTTVVIRHLADPKADELEILAANELGEPVDASPAIVGSEMFIRSDKHLYCISEE